MAFIAVTELPWSLDPSMNFVLGNHALRSSWQNSFFMPADQHVGYALTVSPGAVTGSRGTVVLTPLAGTKYQTSGTPYSFLQLYVADTGNGANPYCVGVSAFNTAFPANTLPIATLVLDEVGRIQQSIDARPSYLSSAPSLGTMTESVADATKRAYFQSNYAVPRTSALTASIPPDVSLPASGFFLGTGSVVLSGNTVTTLTTYLSTAFNGKLVSNAINQGYIDPTTGLLGIRQVQASGVFPANSLALFEATTDGVGLIRSLVDWRPSYI